ncbi:MAG: SIMPL domain-containing protein [Thermoanaerobaculia bacterium]
MKTFLALAIALTVSRPAAAQTPAPIREGMTPVSETIHVTGTGHATVAPDRFSFTVGVQTVADTVEGAVNENNGKTAAVIAALKRAGATDRDIRTANFSIYPQQDYGQNKLPRILGYQVSNSITVRRDNIGEVGKLLQAALGAGVNQSSGLQFEVSDPSRGRDEAMRAAYGEARSKAALLAQTAGRTLGRALSISEGGGMVPPPYPRAMAMRAEAASVSEVPVEAGTQDISYSITVLFELR